MPASKDQALSTDFMEVMRVIKEFLVMKKVGKIEVNCFKGGISSMTVHETLNWKKEQMQNNS